MQLHTTITYLEMTARSDSPMPAAPEVLRVERANGITVAFYRYLYNSVGAKWLWYERRAMTDAELAILLADPAVEVHVAYSSGVPAGFFELDRRHPTDVDLAYFGLEPDFIGRGFGRWFLRYAVDVAWSPGPRVLTVNTNSFDHPRALANYEQAGFSIVRQVGHSFDDPRLTGLI